MKKLILYLILVIVTFWFASANNWTFDTDTNVLTDEQGQVIWDSVWDDAVRWWAWMQWAWEIEWVAQQQEEHQWWLLNFISDVVNYLLALAALVALIYLLYHWFIMVTASGNEDRFKKWAAWLKYWTIALLWIWVSWFMISLVFYVVEIST